MWSFLMKEKLLNELWLDRLTNNNQPLSSPIFRSWFSFLLFVYLFVVFTVINIVLLVVHNIYHTQLFPTLVWRLNNATVVTVKSSLSHSPHISLLSFLSLSKLFSILLSSYKYPKVIQSYFSNFAVKHSKS